MQPEPPEVSYIQYIFDTTYDVPLLQLSSLGPSEWLAEG